MSEQLTRIYVRRAAAQRQTSHFVTLGGLKIGLRFRYCAADERWRMWLLALDGATIVGPISLVPGIDLLAGRKHDPRVPAGQLFVWSPTREPPTADTIDVSAILFYRDA